MALIKFGKKEGQEAATAQPAPGTSIYYDPSLIEKYKSDHRALLSIYEQIHSALATQNFAIVKQKLAEFRAKLQEHLLSENVKLYVYLSRQLATNEESSRLISEFRQEMNGIGRAVMEFLRKYEGSDVGPSQAGALKQELNEIGVILKQRTQREEEALYPLYMEFY